ncbi:MAG: UDP-3-O-(3-hydroxymyristoyl)glucosamine N-acyltransferase [Dissulfurispiraceae bacterium]|jgi:UDP-3-O-[3-hydroxymyristoyl] glucosamine N-acyltransferase|nr:UDP-3-O-(3-hydroxymyristoyl)glucosamine N-acyltransferase [Dissulfurispiraceae bacterium]
MKLNQIAELVKGEISGSLDAGEMIINGVSGISDAREGEITFISSSKFITKALSSNASAFLVSEPFPELAKPQIRVKNPQLAFAFLLRHFYVKPHPVLGVSDRAYIAEGARIGQDATIYPFAYVDEAAVIGARTVIYPGSYIGRGSVVGDDCVIHPNVIIYHGVTIGSRVVLHAGSVIGADGFGYVWSDGIHNKIPQVGGVIIGDDVEIGANVTIDRATTDNTLIGKGTKIDNQVQIGHNVIVGSHVIIVALTGIGGSSSIGDGSVIGAQVGIADHVNIDPGTMIGSQSGVMSDLKRGIYFGSPVMGHREWLKSSALVKKLPEIRKQMQELEQRLAALELIKEKQK